MPTLSQQDTEYVQQRIVGVRLLKYAATQQDAEDSAWALRIVGERTFPTGAHLFEFLVGTVANVTDRPLDLMEWARLRRIVALVGEVVVRRIAPEPETFVAALTVPAEPAEPVMDRCAWCEIPFEPGHGWGIFCSKACGEAEVRSDPSERRKHA